MAASRGRGSRVKGAAAEREFFALLNAGLGMDAFQRNLTQTRMGGSDTEEHHAVAIEVKRQETVRLGPWLEQARAATRPDQQTVLAYRQNGEPWRILVEMDVNAFVDYLKRMQGYGTTL